MFNIIFIGAPGVGKGTQAAFIHKEYSIAHISTGDMLRKNIEDGTELGKMAKSHMDKGELVPDILVIDMLAERIKKDDLGNPDVCMVAYYHNLFSTKEEYENVCTECRAGSRGCVACKKQLAHNIIETLRPIREKRKYYEDHPEIVDKILMEGTAKAQKVAQETMKKVKKAMKLDYFAH